MTPKAREQQSKIDRNGLIAVDDIRNGETVIVYGGVIVPKSDIAKYREMFGDYDLPLDDHFSIAPTSREELLQTGSVNHSCEPTAGWKNSNMIVTIKDVKAGEEISVDYAMHGGYPGDMNCNCGTASCRKVIRQDDWKIPQLQAKYRQWFLPYVRAKF